MPTRCEASGMGFVQWLEPYLFLTYIWESGRTVPLGSWTSRAHNQQMPFQVAAGTSEMQVLQAARNPLGFLGLCQMNTPSKGSLKEGHFTEGSREGSHRRQGSRVVSEQRNTAQGKESLSGRAALTSVEDRGLGGVWPGSCCFSVLLGGMVGNVYR